LPWLSATEFWLPVLFGWFSKLKSSKPANNDVFTGYTDRIGDQVLNFDLIILNERLFHQAKFFVVFANTAADNLVDKIGRFALGQRLIFENIQFPVKLALGDIFDG
jgi:hypothetical protein